MTVLAEDMRNRRTSDNGQQDDKMNDEHESEEKFQLRTVRHPAVARCWESDPHMRQTKPRDDWYGGCGQK